MTRIQTWSIRLDRKPSWLPGLWLTQFGLFRTQDHRARFSTKQEAIEFATTKIGKRKANRCTVEPNND